MPLSLGISVTPTANQVVGPAYPPPGNLTAFALESEASAYISRMTTPPSTARQITINRFIKSLKAKSVYSLLYAAWHLGAASAQASTLNILGSSNTITVQGSPTFAANDGYTSAASANYLDTNWNPTTQAGYDITDFHIAVYSETGSVASGSDVGLFDGTTNGITINLCNSPNNVVTFRANGASTTTGSLASTNDGSNFILLCVKSGNYSLYRNGQLIASGAYTTVQATNLNLYILRLNGSTNVPGRKLSYVSVGKSLTAQQALDYFAAVQTLRTYSRFGDLIQYDAGVGAGSVTADLIVYGATAQGCMAAYEAARQGKTVAIVGGWRECSVGGMSANGLGATDLDSHSALGGLPRVLMTRINSYYSRADTTFTFEPKVFEEQLRALMDATRTGGIDIPVYWSTGVASVTKYRGNIIAITTSDGRVFYGKQFSDASYEGDLAYLAGCTMTVGREAAGTGKEAVNGYRGTSTGTGSGNHQFALGATFYNIDPYNTAGVSGSGLLSGVDAAPAKSNGQADSEVQSYNYRMTTSNNALWRVTPPASAPSGYSITTYEPLLRFMAALTAGSKVYGTDWTLATILKYDQVNSVRNVYDMNMGPSGMGLDLIGGSRSYPSASYAARETIVQSHISYIKGLFYTLMYGRTNGGDLRIPAQLETDARAFWLDHTHYTSPFGSDDYFWPRQMYVREARRLIGDYIHDGNDIAATDGTTPRSIKTIAVASYTMDSHHTQMIADLSGTPRIWLTGNFEDNTNGGTDKLSPVPYEVICPKVTEVNNLTVTFAVAATHVAFGSIRMEYTAMCMGQAAGLAAALAIDSGVAIQNVDYTTLRTRLLASPSLASEVQPVLPQTN